MSTTLKKGLATGARLLLEGATAYVGFDQLKESIANYFLCTGIVDDVPVNASITYINDLGGGALYLEDGAYDITATILVDAGDLSIKGGSDAVEFTFSGTGEVIHVDATANSIRDVHIEYISIITADDLIGIHLEQDGAANVISQLYINNIQIRNCSDGISMTTSHGSNIYRDAFANLFITSVNNRGIDAEGVYMTYSDIEITGVEDNAYAIYTLSGLSSFNDISCDGVIHSDGASSVWNNTAIETIYAAVPPTTTAFRSAGVNTTIISLKLTSIDNDKCDYGLAMFNGSHTIISFYEWGTQGPNYPISGDAAAYGSLIDCVITHGFAWYLLDEASQVGWVVSGGNVLCMRQTYQFIQGTTFISADASAKGWEIDVAAEYAIALGQLPLDMKTVIFIKIWAVALDAPLGAGGHMHAQFIFNAGASNAQYHTATKSWTLATFDSEEEDYIADDVVHWSIAGGDVGAELANLVAGDSFEIKALHEVGAAPDGATDAVFRCVEIAYI